MPLVTCYVGNVGDSSCHASSIIPHLKHRDSMASTLNLAVAATAVHLVLFVSIFDIYFTSQVDSGMEPQRCPIPPPAKRLVLFVADGLRADTLFSLNPNGTSPAPYLRYDIVQSKGKWGVSHTHVPTESRPGHVALIAGLYEDVSAVTHGWQDNPVPFDSVFNRSRHTWSWGSPDILPMFAKGATPGKVDMYTYDAEWEDFADSDASKLDTWVFERVEEFFTRAESDSVLAEEVSQDQVVFFLHLLGIDTNGHSHRPLSKEVIDNVRLVDREIERVVSMIDSFFGDNKTAYVFTSDHGMTNWGSHGAGLPDETMTPLICWGAGIEVATATTYSTLNFHDSYSEKWGLGKYERVDVEQADIAPLMATLIGVPTPINSEGVLPLDFIHYNKGFLANSIYANARQLLEQFRVKAERIRSTSLPLTFKPFHKLSLEESGDYKLRIHNYIREKTYQEAIDLSQQLISLVKEGVRYYHTYHRHALMLVTVLGFLGWISYTVLVILEQVKPVTRPRGSTYRYPIKTIVIVSIIFILLLLQSSPLLYYLYYGIAVVTWSYVWRNKEAMLHVVLAAKWNPTETAKIAVAVIFAICGLELLVLSFFFREVLTVLLLLLSLWPYFTWLTRDHLKLCLSWTCTCFALAVFPLLPVVGRNANYLYVTACGLTFVGCVIFLVRKLEQFLFTPDLQYFHSKLFVFQTAVLGAASFVPLLTNYFFSQKEAIPFLVNAFSWATLALSITAPIFGPKSLSGRLLHLALSLYTVFILLSTSFEAIFILLFCAGLYIWLVIEEKLAGKQLKVIGLWDSLISFQKQTVTTLLPDDKHTSTRPITADNIRQVAMCLIFGILSFFGIGNIASINTFDPSTVYCFLTVFSPFVMGSLILLKMVIPFVYVSCAYNSIVTLLGQCMRNSLLLMLIMTDIMALNFFFLVRDSGSWLEIGISISHYVIMMVVCVGAVILMGVARLLTGVTVIPRNSKDHIF